MPTNIDKKSQKEKGWPALFEAINGKNGRGLEYPDWERAARESRRGDVGEARNDETRKRFEKAAKQHNLRQ